MVETPIGQLPRPQDLDLAGLDVSQAALAELLSVDREQWRQEAADIGQYLQEYGSRTPAALQAELTKLQARLSA
jgi:phosphoenolpyruvate carboxykinase (GTP)